MVNIPARSLSKIVHKNVISMSPDVIAPIGIYFATEETGISPTRNAADL